MSELVYILKEDLERLVKAKVRLDALNACGVDNWHGYGESFEYFEEQEGTSFEDVVEERQLYYLSRVDKSING